jgi:hypothetical protein
VRAPQSRMFSLCRSPNRDARALSVRFENVKPTDGPFLVSDNSPPFITPNATKFRNGVPTVRRDAIGQCIYCGTTTAQSGNRRLSDEHIVAEGLGGHLVLPEASCDRCSAITATIEGSILRTILLTPRRFLQIRGKKRKRNEKAFPLSDIVDGKMIKTDRPLDEHPSVILLPVFEAPGILLNRPQTAPGLAGYWMDEIVPGSINELAKRGLSNFATPSLDMVRYCQFISKIAHGFAVSELGLQGFNPLLPQRLLLQEIPKTGSWCDCYYLVGGETTTYARDTNLHKLGWSIEQAQNIFYIVVAIRLFGHLGSPAFKVVAGTVDGHRLSRALEIERTSILAGRI